jgi:AcrR family transcriptional regulator
VIKNSVPTSSLRKKSAAIASTEPAQLDQTAWLRAAMAAIAEDGFNGIRVLPLSKRLGVTRGSFYWHFADHAAFVTAFIEYWRHQQLRAVEAYQHTKRDAVSAYRQLLDVVLTDTESELKRLKVEFALRGYARRDKLAADAVAVVDKARIDLFLPIVSAIATDANEAESFATLLLVQLSGAQHAIAGPNCSPAQLARLKEAMLAQLAAIYEVRSTSLRKKSA